MKSPNFLLVLISIFLIAGIVSAGSLHYFVKPDYSSRIRSDSLSMSWKTDDDYLKDETKVLNLIKWLDDNPFYENNDFRKRVSGYVLGWFVGAPHIKLTINSELLYEKGEKVEGSALVLEAYMNAKGAYLIRNKDNPDEMKANIEGIKSGLKIYSQFLERNPESKMALMEKYKALKSDEKLEEFIKSRLEKK